MKRISRAQEMEMRRQLQSWMEARNVPLVLFDKLQPHKKTLLHNLICVGTLEATDYQLRELYRDLGMSEIRSATESGGHYPPTEELRGIFRPDGTHYLRKF